RNRTIEASVFRRHLFSFLVCAPIPTLFYPGKTRDTSAFYFFLTFAQDFVQAVFAELIKQIETADS
ncbi:MAG: hypothetical protein P8183_19825, partial [Anaerolineae bacterium]